MYYQMTNVVILERLTRKATFKKSKKLFKFPMQLMHRKALLFFVTLCVFAFTQPKQLAMIAS